MSPQATDDEIKKAYRALAREYHPDANPDDPARGRTVQGDQRRVRDGARPRTAAPVRHVRPRWRAGRRRQPVRVGRRSVSTTCSTRSSAATRSAEARQAGRRGAAPTPRPSSSSRSTRSCFGVRQHGRARACPSSARPATARAGEPGTHAARCETCDGAGEVRQVRRSLLGQIVTAGPCPTCSGARNDRRAARAPRAAATGRVRAFASIDVDVPAGIDDGQRLRLAGRGPAAPRGGIAGDLYVAVHVAPHASFRREGDELLASTAGVDRASGARARSRTSRPSTAQRDRSAVRYAARSAASGSTGSACRHCARAAGPTS